MGICNSKDKILKETTLLTCKDITYNFTKAKVVDVYDGDTMTIAAWFNNEIIMFKVRLFGIDCPELRTNKADNENEEEKKSRKRSAMDAKNYIENNILGKIVTIDVLNNKPVDSDKLIKDWSNYVEDAQILKKYCKSNKKYREKWGRLLANIYYNDINIAQDMISKKLGYCYFGGTKH